MATYREPPYFEGARTAGRIVVLEPPKLDLETYIQNYKGRTRFHRLYHIGGTSSYLCLEALKAAILEAKAGKDVTFYEQAVKLLKEIAPEEPEANLEQQWVDRTAQEVTAESARLEQELKGYKNNLIKESIRMGYDDLGRHYYQTGNSQEATAAFGKERQHCTLPSHITSQIFQLISVFVDTGNWISVDTHVQKLRQVSQTRAELEKAEPKLNAVMGLAQMSQGHFGDAAHSFIRCDPYMIQAKLDDPLDEDAYNDVMTPNDIATYGALCALASMDRSELQTQILGNTNFRSYLELEPHLRRAITSFVSGKYAMTLSILESYRPDYLLDLHLSKHYHEILNRVRSKALIQYFNPFSRATLSALSEAFGGDEATIETTVVDLIRSGALKARLDLEKRVLLAEKIDSHHKVHDEALAAAKNYERTAQLRILRMEISYAGLDVYGKSQSNLQGMLQMAKDDNTTEAQYAPNAKSRGLRTVFRH